LGSAFNLDYLPYDLPDGYRFNPTLLTALAPRPTSPIWQTFSICRALGLSAAKKRINVSQADVGISAKQP